MHAVFKNGIRNALGRLVKDLEHFFFANWLEIDVIFKNGLRNGLGHLVKALEHFLRKLILNARSFQNWYQKCSRTLS